MRIDECLLDRANNRAAEGATIGERIRAAGKEHLWEDRQGVPVDTIVVHYTSSVQIAPRRPFDLALVLKIFCDYGVSSHYLITRRGAVTRLVPEEFKAWHCGGSVMPSPDDRRAVNGFSIGIELMATADSGFTSSQYRALSRLCADIERRHARRFIYTGHDQIAGARALELGLRKEVKVDPGKLFDWELFFRLLEKTRSGLPEKNSSR